MKTTISIPDAQFEAADKVAKRLGMSRSQLYRKAIADFLARDADYRVTEKLSDVYAESPASQLDTALQWMQAKSISKERWYSDGRRCGGPRFVKPRGGRVELGLFRGSFRREHNELRMLGNVQEVPIRGQEGVPVLNAGRRDQTVDGPGLDTL